MLYGSLSPTSEGPRRLSKHSHWQRRREPSPAPCTKARTARAGGPHLAIARALPRPTCHSPIRHLPNAATGPHSTSCPLPAPPPSVSFPPLPAAPATPCASLPAPLTSRSRSGTQTHRNGLRFSSPFPFRSPASRHHHSHQVPSQSSRTTSSHASPSPLHSDSSFALFQPVSDFFSRQKVRKSCPLSCVLISDLYLRVCGFPMHVDRMQRFLCSFGFGFDGPRNVDRER